MSLSAIRAQQTAAGTSTSLKRGTVERSLGSTPVVATQNAPAPKEGIVEQFAHKVGAVGSQTFSAALQLGNATRSYVKNAAVDIAHQTLGASRAINPALEYGKVQSLSILSKQLDKKQTDIINAYKMGNMSKEDYSKSLRDISDAYGQLSGYSQKIQREDDPQKLVSDVAWTAINVASGGGATIVKTGAKPIVEAGLKGVLAKSVTKVEDALVKVPAMKDLYARNAAKVVSREQQKMAGETTEQWLARSGKQIAVGLLIKRPIFYQQNIGLANEAYDHILKGDFKEALTPAAWLGAQMIGGGPLLAGAKFIKGKAGELSKGRGSMIDELSRRTDTNLAKYISDVPDSEKTWRIAQHTNMAAAGGRADEAADNFLQPYIQAGVDLKTITEKELTDGMAKWAAADELRIKRLSSGIIKGVDPSEVDKYAVVRWDTVMKDGLTRELAQTAPSDALDLNARQTMLEKLIEISERPGVGWGNNEALLLRLQNIVANADTVTDLAKGIKQIDTASVALKGMPKKIAKEFADLGYTIAAPFGGNKIARVDYESIAKDPTKRLVSGAVDNNPEIFDAATAPQPILSAISGALTKTGLSPEGNAQAGYRKLSEALIGDLGELDVARPLALEGKGDMVNGGRAILSQLQDYVEKKKGAFGVSKISGGKSAVTDIRQLTNGEISTALNITDKEAGEVSKAVRNAYTKVPLEFRGLGDKIVDYAIAAPLSPMRYYQRVQSALRYTYNPFFRFQEQVETNLLASMDANKFIWAHRGLDNTVDTLTKAGLFEGNVFGAGADDAVVGRISANLTKFQKRNLAGLAESIAKGQGKTVQQVLQDNPEQIDDALRMIVQYPKKGSLSSPLARTINLAFFPMRYNAKVATIAAEKLATMPPSIQFATIQGLFKMKDWLKSDEGIKWQAEHADAIQVFSWATPVGNISQIYKVLSGNVNAAGDLGLLGGLPFGVISQVLDGQGIININTPYVNPKTGEQIPDYIPKTTRAEAAVALQDLLGTMFSFPGRTLGLPGKEAELRKAVGLFIDTNGKDFEKKFDTKNLTDTQKNMIRVLQGDTSDKTIQGMYYAPAPGQFDYYTLPPSTIPVRTLTQAQTPNVTRRTSLPTKAEIAAAKKAAKKSGRDANGNKIKPLPTPITRS